MDGKFLLQIYEEKGCFGFEGLNPGTIPNVEVRTLDSISTCKLALAIRHFRRRLHTQVCKCTIKAMREDRRYIRLKEYDGKSTISVVGGEFRSALHTLITREIRARHSFTRYEPLKTLLKIGQKTHRIYFVLERLCLLPR